MERSPPVAPAEDGEEEEPTHPQDNQLAEDQDNDDDENDRDDNTFPVAKSRHRRTVLGSDRPSKPLDPLNLNLSEDEDPDIVEDSEDERGAKGPATPKGKGKQKSVDLLFSPEVSLSLYPMPYLPHRRRFRRLLRRRSPKVPGTRRSARRPPTTMTTMATSLITFRKLRRRPRRAPRLLFLRRHDQPALSLAVEVLLLVNYSGQSSVLYAFVATLWTSPRLSRY